jgi:Beta-lactamase class C and other penicillin binding proteins
MTPSASTELDETITRLLQRASADGLFSGAVCRVAIGGEDAASVALGVKATIGDDGMPLAADVLEPVDDGTFFDLASVTKVFSAHTILSLVDRRALALDDSVGAVLAEYCVGAKAAVTLRHLLTHTSGLPAEWLGWRDPLLAAAAHHPSNAEPFRAWPLDDRVELVADLLGTPLTAAPGSRWEYSDAGLNTAMLLAERVAGAPWSTLVSEHTLMPLGLAEATFAPDRDAAAATEYQPRYARGVVRGNVHDEASWSLGGACANAGMFATAGALLRFGEAIRVGDGWVRGEALWHDQLDRMLGPVDARPTLGFGAALGLRIGETEWMSDLGRASRGHTGFTGTSLQIDRAAGAVIVLLTNRVHPSRDGGSLHPLRRAVAGAVLRAGRPFDRLRDRGR